jgi:hypothetical protein
MDQRGKNPAQAKKKSRRGHWIFVLYCGIRTAVWNISDIKEGRI